MSLVIEDGEDTVTCSHPTSKERLTLLLGTKGNAEIKREGGQNPACGEAEFQVTHGSGSVDADLALSVFFMKVLPCLLAMCLFLFWNNSLSRALQDTDQVSGQCSCLQYLHSSACGRRADPSPAWPTLPSPGLSKVTTAGLPSSHQLC